ncbi:uncharacterized protein LOC131148560 [Malania oleifera]|uniref:uncharacterized protein LOC131148560 n=1 Tax=Malania oleifera TaxID=397392 RepID=UPI0025ADB37F|nr:uncharacterized protein LOC131148560 [Malania oleifera]XP_057954324.1 uncharacterized protein LOC131148560 [Malania oleifera]
MSPASKSKSKDKKAGKDSQKASTKLPGAAGAGSGIPASAYNPLLGTFHTLDTVPAYTAQSHGNGRFRNIDESDEHIGNPLGTGADYDSVSNNGSWSGESEDHKDKAPNHPAKLETIPGADNDKREKIRQKNERKHQRQKERRAQELHERCSGYLMSRKLEALAHQLVAMGFSSERATMALILNEGKVEESVTWLFEGHEEADKYRDQNLGNGSNLKIDISEELARIADMEIRYKCSRQEVERVIVASEGDLEKAAEALRMQKQDLSSAPEETGDPPNVNKGKLSAAANQNLVKPQQKSNSSTSIQLKRDEKDFNYAKTAVPVLAPSDSGSKNVQPSRKIQPKSEWARPQQIVTPVEKKWPGGGSNPSVSYSLAPPLQASALPGKTETRYVAVGSEARNLQPGLVREPVIMMQRPKSINTEQAPATSISSSPPGTAANWYPGSVEIMKSNGLLQHIPSTRNLSPNNLSSNQLYQQQGHPQQQQQFVDFPGTYKGNGSWSRAGSSPTLAAASSLGLFSGLGSSGSSGSSSPVDWSTGASMLHLDYTNIDWSLDRGLSSSKPHGLWLGMAPFMMDESDASGVGAKPAVRSIPSNRNGVLIGGLQDGGVATAETPAANSREWSSPFEGKDLFSLPRQFVSSPSL